MRVQLLLLEDLPDTSPGPEARYETREALALAFAAGLQHLPPRQRAVLVLRDVLGFRAAEVAGILDSSEVSVNSALQRARAALDARLPAADRELAPLPRSPRERELVGRFVDAFESADVERVVALLTDDAWLTMPPEPLEYQGRAAIARFLPGPQLVGSPGAPARAHPREQPARVRLLPPGPPGADRARPRADRAHARRRPDLRHHPLRRQQPLPPLRAAPDSARIAEIARGETPPARKQQEIRVIARRFPVLEATVFPAGPSRQVPVEPASAIRHPAPFNQRKRDSHHALKSMTFGYADPSYSRNGSSRNATMSPDEIQG
jgi:hypothetical protein